MAAATALGGAVVALVLYGVQAIVAGSGASDAPVTQGPAPLLLLSGTLGALLLSAVVAWRRLRPVDSYYRRGALTLVAAFGTFVLALLATPVYHFLGGGALLGLSGLGAAAGALLLRPGRARSAGR